MPHMHYTRAIGGDLKVEATENATNAALAFAPPADAADTKTLTRSEYVEMTREQSRIDPEYLPGVLERMAPVQGTLPNGKKMRVPSGIAAFHALMKEARPDLYAQVTGDLAPIERAAAKQELF